jgi:hypothetical protein
MEWGGGYWVQRNSVTCKYTFQVTADLIYLETIVSSTHKFANLECKIGQCQGLLTIKQNGMFYIISKVDS